jgi:type IV secretion system protein VirB5
MNKYVKHFLLVVLVVTMTTPVYAIVGVDDIALLTQQLTLLKKQYTTLKKTYATADKQLKSAENLVNLNKGHSGFGSLYNTASDLKKRESASSWRETLKGVSGGNQARYTELVRAYEKQHTSLDNATFRQGASSVRSAQFDSEKEITKAASIESEAVLNEINEALKRIHDLSDEIEKANTTKSAIDLNTRMLTEIAYLSVQNLKAQALLNQQLASKAGSTLEDEAALASYLAP